MRTGRSLTVFWNLLLLGGRGCTWSQGVYLVRGVPGPGGCTWSGGYLVWGVPGPGGTWSWGVYLVGGVPGPRGCTWSGGRAWSGTPPPLLWTEWMTDRCKNITLAKTSFRPVKKNKQGYKYNLQSARLRRSAGRDGCLSPRLPPVKHKKKHSKRCYFCAKKTGLATSYQCR